MYLKYRVLCVQKDKKGKKNITTCYRPDKQAINRRPAAPLPYVTKEGTIELHNPSPGRHQCHKVYRDWLNKKTSKVSKPQSAIWDVRLHLLKGEGPIFLFFSLSLSAWSVWKFSKSSETGDSEWRRSLNASGILVVKMMRGKKDCWLPDFWAYQDVKCGSFFSFGLHKRLHFFLWMLHSFKVLQPTVYSNIPRPYWIAIDANFIVAIKKKQVK